RADQQVESVTLRAHLDASIDDVDEKKALVLAFDQRLTAAPEDDAYHFLEAVREGSRRPIRYEAELSYRSHHPLASVDTRGALAVEDARYGGDRDAGAAGDVIDRESYFGSLRFRQLARSPSFGSARLAL